MQQHIRPTESELAILQILWKEGDQTVRQINDKLNIVREVGYTTTLKHMQLMIEKNLLNRNTDTKQHIYSAKVKEGKTKKHLLQNFIESTFRGSASTLVMQALGNEKTSDGELKEIKQLIKDIEKKRNNK